MFEVRPIYIYIYIYTCCIGNVSVLTPQHYHSGTRRYTYPSPAEDIRYFSRVNWNAANRQRVSTKLYAVYRSLLEVV